VRKVLFILSELADTDVEWMMQNGARATCPRGTVLIEEGRPIEVLYVLLDGRLSVSLAAAGGRQIALLQSGEVLGELSFLDSRPPSATVTALDDATVLRIPRALLQAKLAADTAFAARFYRALGLFLASRLRRTQQRLGYDPERDADDGTAGADELDPALLDGVALAGARFDWMLRRLREAQERGPGEN
jgi:bacteriocin-type transport-associated protein